MADIVSSEKRSANMAAIKGKDTGPEIYLRKQLFARGYRYRKNVSSIYGHPDIFLPKYRTAVFVNGCFWHRHPGCKYAYTPKSRIEFWEAKFQANILRDQQVKRTLSDEHVKQLVVWECTIKRMKKESNYNCSVLDTIEQFLTDDCQYLEI